MQVPVQTHFLAQCHSVSAGCIGQHNAQASQFAQAVGHATMARTQFFQALETMGTGQKVVRVGLMMAHHAQKGCAISKPILGAQLAGLLVVQLQVFSQVAGHLPVDLGQNVGGCMVQGVVKIKQIHFAGQARMGTTNITNAQNEWT